MFDIITFGSATRDIFLKIRDFKLVKEKKFITGKGICFPFGSKIDVKEIYFSSGGGGTNTAATFSRQGFEVAFCGMVGEDISGQEIIRELKELGVVAELVFKTKKAPTNHSIILSSGKKDRTILVYRGASELLSRNQIPWQKLKAKWFYLGPLSGKLSSITKDIVDFARKKEIKIAFNPGNSQFKLPKRVLEEILKKVDILILNREEASLLTGVPYEKEREIFKKIDQLCSGIAVTTRGSEGVVVSDGKYLYAARPPESKVVDRTGAGDSFASGFVSGYLYSKGNIEYAIQLGIANSTSCLEQIGAKNGLLKKGEKFKEVKVQKIIINETRPR